MYNHDQLSLPTEMPRAILSQSWLDWPGPLCYPGSKGQGRAGGRREDRPPGLGQSLRAGGARPNLGLLSPTLSSQRGVGPKTCISNKSAGAAAAGTGTTV